MKSLKLLQILFLFALCFCSSCEKDELTTLPPETQEGANTFGCYVNEELFVAEKGYGPFGGRYLSAGYAKNMDLLTISAYGKNGDIGFAVLNPQERIKLFF